MTSRSVRRAVVACRRCRRVVVPRAMRPQRGSSFRTAPRAARYRRASRAKRLLPRSRRSRTPHCRIRHRLYRPPRRQRPRSTPRRRGTVKRRPRRRSPHRRSYRRRFRAWRHPRGPPRAHPRTPHRARVDPSWARRVSSRKHRAIRRRRCRRRPCSWLRSLRCPWSTTAGDASSRMHSTRALQRSAAKPRPMIASPPIGAAAPIRRSRCHRRH